LSDNSVNVSTPSSVTVPAGTSTANFNAAVSAITTDQTAVITASANGVSRAFSLGLVAPARLQSLSCTLYALITGQSSTCTVRLTKAALAAMTVALSSNLGALPVPASLNIGAGSNSGVFSATAGTLSSSQTATVTAGWSGQSLAVQIAVSPAAPAGPRVSGLVCTPLTLAVNAFAGCTVTLDKPASPALDVTITASSSSISAPSRVTVQSGQSKASFRVLAANAGATDQFVTLRTSGGGGNASVVLKVLKSGSSAISTLDPRLHSLTNAASFDRGDVCSPGSWASIFGAGFTSQSPQPAATVPLPSTLAGVQVLVSGSPAPILYASDGLINFQCPMLAPATLLEVQVIAESGVSTDPISTEMQPARPTLFALDSSGSGQGAVLIANTDQVAMSHREEVPSRPAFRGEYLSIYGNGLGEVEHNVPAGWPAPLDRLLSVKHEVRVVLGGVEIVPSFAGLTPGVVSLFQVNAAIPQEAPVGPAVPLFLKVTLTDGTTLTTNQVTVAIEDQPLAQSAQFLD
jgi:uncharacterized protein (TIGR03437 family)